MHFNNYLKVGSLLCLLICGTYASSQAQIVNESGSFMATIHNYITNDIPLENSEGYVKADSADLARFKVVFDLVLNGQYAQANDSVEAYFPSYELVAFTDTVYSSQLYYVLRETTVTKGWGIYAFNPTYQRDVMLAVPHPLFDSNTPYEGVDMLQYLGGRVFAMAGTHRCAAAEATSCSGTTSACSGDNSQQNFKISDMAHNDSTVFQKAHEALLEESASAFFLNIHGHNRASCEDIFISNGREDDTQPILEQLRDSLLAHNIDVAVPGDITDCTLYGSTNTQGRYVNGSSDPCGTSNLSNTGKFFHVEQSVSSRKSTSQWRVLIEEFGDIIPRSFNTVTLPEFSNLSINEIHFFPIAPDGDANGNGSVQTVSDEFVEIVNSGSEVFDLEGWSLADNTQSRHVFPYGSVLVPSAAIVVFGGSFSGDFKGSIVQTSSTGALSLNNNSESILLVNPYGAPVYSVSYDTTDTNFQGGSLVRNPDITGNFEYHKSADTADNSWFSPGTKTNASSFVPFAEITSVAGWRILSAPSTSYSLRNLEALTAVQGFGDNLGSNLYTSYNGTQWVAPNSLDETLSAGQGFIIYFYNNSINGSNPLPITLRANDASPSQDVTIDLHANGNKFNLIGNPFNSAIDFSQISANSGALSSIVGHIWDPKVEAYTTTFVWNDEVGAWQGLMLENDNAESITVPYASLISSGNFANGDVLKVANQRSMFKLTFIEQKGDFQKLVDQIFLVIDPEAKGQEEKFSAKKLNPLSDSNKNFAWRKNAGDSTMYLQRTFSDIAEQEPLFIEELGESQESIIIKFERLYGQLNNVQLSFEGLVDVNNFTLADGDSIIVSALPKKALPKNSKGPTLLQSGGNPRWKVSLNNATQTSNEPLVFPFEMSLSQNYPNPFNPSTSISVVNPLSQEITLEVLSLVGEQVATIHQGQLSAGRHLFTFRADGLSSGVYVYRLRSGSTTISRKMILLK